MKTLTLFSSYFESGDIPYYIRFYLEGLKPHSDQLVFATNEKVLSKESIDFLQKNRIAYVLLKNEGYDFGMWGKALEEYIGPGYTRLILANDSCILLRPLGPSLDKINKEGWDYAGLLDSPELEPHIQSYFLVLSGKAIPVFRDYLNREGIKQEMKQVIHTYEVGLSGQMKEKGLKTGSVYAGGKTGFNPVYSEIGSLVEKGFPLIKKKMIFDLFNRKERVSLLRNDVATGSERYFGMLEEKLGGEVGSIDLNLLQADQKRYGRSLVFFGDKLYIFGYRILRMLAGKKNQSGRKG